jgi:FlaA1/EpsC-like NDP-sugar epimerase
VTAADGLGTAARNGSAHLDHSALERLLGRSVRVLGGDGLGSYLTGTTVLVTGAGGSIGAELCARLVPLGVQRLVLVDRAESALVARERELRHELGFSGTVPVLADIASRPRMFDVFERYRPDVAFHAAAYKHVPLLEASPVEGVAANVLGTRCVVDAALRVGVQRFLLFSTDKAVRPTSVLGQTKAVAEWVVAAAGRDTPQARYASIRLGNVVDSAGSIVPVFRRQAERGGPVTVTHPDATRYLMTAGEAAGLAIVAAGLAGTRDVFWLDVGPAVRTLEVARRVASTVSHDVGVEVVGLRAGERLHEHLFRDGDPVAATSCEHVWRTAAQAVDPAWLDDRLAELTRRVRRADAAGVRATLAEMLIAPRRMRVPAEVVA